MSRPPPPEGWIWREDAEAVKAMLLAQAEAIMWAARDRILARLAVDFDSREAIVREELELAAAEIDKLALATKSIPSAHS